LHDGAVAVAQERGGGDRDGGFAEILADFRGDPRAADSETGAAAEAFLGLDDGVAVDIYFESVARTDALAGLDPQAV
jgi:hypothetical protein